jgi:hypothetical protein
MSKHVGIVLPVTFNKNRIYIEGNFGDALVQNHLSWKTLKLSDRGHGVISNGIIPIAYKYRNVTCVH